VLLVYLGALIAAACVLAVQLAFGHHAGGDVHATDHAGVDHDANVWTFIGSVRFWSFALLAFGLVGTLLTAFGFAGVILTAVLATTFGLASGVVAVSAIRKLAQRTSSSHATEDDVVGRVGRVVVPPNEAGRCKVRVEIKGSMIDYVATAREPMSEGDDVLVEEARNSELTVSRAPKELKP
jgi:membrane protein implicated in regulation of membrane protease activity